MGGSLSIFLFLTTLPAAERALAPRSYDVEVFDVTAIEEGARSGRPVELRWFGRTRKLIIEPSRLRGRGFRAMHLAVGSEGAILERPRTFRGSLEDEPESIVRLGIVEGSLRGMVKSSEGWVFFEPFREAEARAGGDLLPEGAHKVFTEGDIDLSFEGVCGEPEEHAPPPALLRGSPAELAATSLQILELAADGDFEFFQLYGSNATAEIESILNVVDGIFEAEIGVTIQLVRTRIWSAEPDPYTSTDANALLTEFRTNWNANESAVLRDTAHLFTGKDLDGSTVGMAGLRAICNSNAYGLSQDLASDVIMPLLVAHEIGHNLGSGHDPSTSDPKYIMSPILSASNLDEFSAQSKTSISSYISGLSCLAVEPGTDPTEPPPPPSTTPKKSGGGGGPVDPAAIILLGAALLAAERRRSNGKT